VNPFKLAALPRRPGMTDLVDLARRFVDLSEQLDQVRLEIAKAVSGDTVRPTPRPASRSNGADGRVKTAAAKDEEVLTLLKPDHPISQSEIARAMQASPSTTQNRLHRLKLRSLAVQDEAGKWLSAPLQASG
jgi:DNA-binding IclR family transcriptional regulator